MTWRDNHYTGTLDGTVKLPVETGQAGGAYVTPSQLGQQPTSILGVSIDGSTIPATAGAPYQMQAADRVVDVNKSTGAATKLLLPTNPMLWVEYTIIDGKGDAATNNITVAGVSGVTINGAATLVIDGNNLARSFRAVNATTWRIT